MLALFDSAEAALAFGTLIQSEFREQAVWEDGEPIELRIGVNLGEVDARQPRDPGALRQRRGPHPDAGGAGLDGDHGGRTACGTRAAGLAFTSIGAPALKNIAEPIEVFAVEALTVRPAEAGAAGRRRGGAGGRAATVRSDKRPATARSPSWPSAISRATPSHDYFSEGFVDGIIGDLSRFRSLTVIARHSASLFSLKSRSAREIGHRLGADYLLSGSLQRAGKKLRVILELIDAESKPWSGPIASMTRSTSCSRSRTRSPARWRPAFRSRSTSREHRREARIRPTCAPTGSCFAASRWSCPSPRKPMPTDAACSKRRSAARRSYARAYSASSRTHNLDWRYAWSADSAGIAGHGRRAWRSAPSASTASTAHAFAELGFAHLYSKCIDEALADYGQALALNPNDADVITQYGDALTYAGQPDRAMSHLERAMRLNPFYPDWYLWCLADAYDALGRRAMWSRPCSRMENPDQGRRLLAANLAPSRADRRSARARPRRFCAASRVSGQLWADRMPYRDRGTLSTASLPAFARLVCRSNDERCQLLGSESNQCVLCEGLSSSHTRFTCFSGLAGSPWLRPASRSR